MSIVHSFVINNLVCQQTIFGRPDFISQINVEVTSVDVDGLTAKVKGSILLQPGDEFTAFSELTQGQVNSWVENSADYALLKEAGERSIYELRYPSIIIRDPPWPVVEPTTSTSTVTNVSTSSGGVV